MLVAALGSAAAEVGMAGRVTAGLGGWAGDMSWALPRGATLAARAAPIARTPPPLCRAAGHESWVLSVSAHPSGAAFATGSSDGKVKLWDLGTRTCAQVGRAALGTRPVPLQRLW